MEIRSTGSAESGARGAGETGRRHEKGGTPMYISYIVGVGGGGQNNNPFEAEKSSSMDKKDNYNTEAVEELIVNWRKLMLQQETQVMLKF